MFINSIKIIFFFLCIFFYSTTFAQILLPTNSIERDNINELEITKIGAFSEWRKERPGIPAHYHTGIDIKRPNNNYLNEPIFPIAEGIVISIRDDGPYAQIIIEHYISGLAFWTLYEHVAGIEVTLYENVTSNNPIARFMNTNELNRYGWQFDHFHFEVMKIKPFPLSYNDKMPQRKFNSYSLICYNVDDLNKYYFNPIEFLKKWF